MSERDYTLLGLIHELCEEVRKHMPKASTT
jgi:hypothetical protein